MNTIRMEEMTSPDINGTIEAGSTTAVVAVGSTEQHGPHLPTMTDARIGDEVAHRVALRLGGALQARTIDVGISEHHLGFAGTLSFTPETLRLILHDYVDSFVRHGLRRIVFLPSHGGNFATVERAVEEARAAHPGIEITGCTDLFRFTDFLNSLSAEYGVSAEASGAHAGENETSMMMAIEAPLVASERFAPGYLGPTGEAELQVILEKGMPALTSNGVLGDPRTASAEKGEVYIERLVAFLTAELKSVGCRAPGSSPGRGASRRCGPVQSEAQGQGPDRARRYSRPGFARAERDAARPTRSRGLRPPPGIAGRRNPFVPLYPVALVQIHPRGRN